MTLQASVYLPDEETHGKGPWPLVVAAYGGPHVQYARNTWGMMTADMRSQFLRANGFAVLKVDNRGSNRRGLDFEAAIYGNLGDLEVADACNVVWSVRILNASNLKSAVFSGVCRGSGATFQKGSRVDNIFVWSAMDAILAAIRN